MRIGQSLYPDVLDPQKSLYVFEVEVLKLTYEGLLSLDNQGNVGPGSADRWESSPDGTQMTFHVRDGLVRSDGTPMACADFEYALKREVDPAVPAKQYTAIVYDIKGAEDLDAFAAQDATQIDQAKLDAAWKNYGVSCKDERNLVVTFSHPVGFWEYVASTWVTYPTDKRQVDKDPNNWWALPQGHVGNGPFKIAAIQDGQKITFVPNENYWRGKPKLDRIELIYSTDSAVLFEAYKKNELDMYPNPPPEQLSLIDGGPLQADFVRYPAAITYGLHFNLTKGKFSDVNVRKAFSAAIDRAGFVRDVQKGLGRPYTRWIPPGVPGAQPDTPGVPDTDPKAAVEFLVENGYAARDSTPNNPRVDCAKLGEVKLTYGANPVGQIRAQFLASNLMRVLGCLVILDPVDATTFAGMTKNVQTTPMLSRQGWSQDYPHPQSWLSVYWTCNGIAKLFGYCNKRLDATLAQADRTLDFEQAIKLYQSAEDMLVNDVPSAFLYHDENRFLIKPWLLGPRSYPSSGDAEWAGEWGPVWLYDVDLSEVPSNYPKE